MIKRSVCTVKFCRDNSFYNWSSNIFNKTGGRELNICLMNFDSRSEKRVLGQRKSRNPRTKGLGSHCSWGQCLSNAAGLLQKKGLKQLDRWREKKENKLPLEQDKHMTSPFCHRGEFTPLCSVEMGIDWDPRATKNRGVSVMSNMHRPKDQ